jgi:hypothetical protein
MDLLTQAQKNELSLQIDNIADTFKREIVVYKSPNKIIVSSDPNYNPFDSNNQNIFNPENEWVQSKFYARILYRNYQDGPYMTPYVGGTLDEAQAKLRSAEGIVRIKIHKNDYENFIKEAKKIEFDGFMFLVETLERPHGLFNTQYYTYYLKRDA